MIASKEQQCICELNQRVAVIEESPAVAGGFTPAGSVMVAGPTGEIENTSTPTDLRWDEANKVLNAQNITSFGRVNVGRLICVTSLIAGDGAITATESAYEIFLSGFSFTATVPDGSHGQIIFFVLSTALGGTCTLIPDARVGYSSIIFTTSGATLCLFYGLIGWVIISSRNVTINP